MASPPDPSISIPLAQRIDAACDRYEEAWQRDEQPSLAETVRGWSADEQRPLLRELLPLDILYRRKRGETPSVEDYRRDFPELETTWLESLLAPTSSGSGEDLTVDLSQTQNSRRSRAGESLGVIRYFGDYELLDEIARGGMGVVYRARQLSLDRIVAIKRVLSGQLASGEELERFVNEAKTAALLDHPNIVPLYEVGMHEGQHYLSMGFVDGPSLDRVIASDLPDPTEAARLVAIVCDAIQFAHERGIVHRDLKPSNILLEPGGKPRITDFGLAKRLNDDASLTASGQVLGTPSYMPPEQAAGRIDAIGPWSDIYSIGAILYALLTGRPPFKAASAVQTLNQVLERDPPQLTALNPSIPRDLETIALKCLEKAIPRRYASARDVADELRRYLEGRPILARPVGVAQRAWRWCRRNPLAASLLTLFLGTLITGIAVSSRFAWLERRRAIAEAEARADERAARVAAEKQRDIAEGLNDLLNRDILGQADIWNQAESSGRVDPNITVKATLDRAAERVEKRFENQPEVEVAVRRALGSAFSALGDQTKALAQLRLAVELGRKTPDCNPYETLGAQYQLGKTYWFAGQPEQAISTLRECIAAALKEGGDDVVEVLQAQMSLGVILTNVNRNDEALQLLESIAPVVERALPSRDANVIHFLNSLGNAQLTAKKREESLATFTKAYQLAEAEFGDRNPLTLLSLNNRARWYLIHEQPAEGARLFEQLEPLALDVFGPDNPSTLMTRANLAFCYLKTGQTDQALERMEDVATHMRKSPGPAHPQTRVSLLGLAQARKAAGQHEAAAKLFEELLNLSAAAPGPPEVMPPQLVWQVAEIYAEQKQREPLVALMRNYLNFLSSSPDIPEPQLAGQLDESARYLLIAQAYDGAEVTARRSFDLRRKLHADSWRCGWSESLLGEALLGQQRAKEAQTHLLSGYQKLRSDQKSIPILAKSLTLDAIRRIVRLYEELGEAEEADAWRAKLSTAEAASEIELP